jgi:hypothetical protein
MEQAFAFFRNFEIWIYILLGLGILLALRKFIMAWQELRGAAFGLERDNAQARLNQSSSVLVLLITMVVAEFVMVSFIVPAFPGAMPPLTPTLDLLTTPTVTLGAAAGPALSAANGQTTTPPAAATTVPGTEQAPENGCIPGKVQIDSPSAGSEVSGLVAVSGTVNIENFGFYKIESRKPDDATWSILLAGNQPVTGGALGTWDTRRLTPGEYQISVVPVDTEARTLPRCAVNVFVTTPPLETEEP